MNINLKLFCLLLGLGVARGVQAENLMLLKSYTNQNLQGWVMSEKLDGVRGFWNGKKLLTRGNRTLTPPHYFLQNFPTFAIDGELFTKRNDFQRISSIVRSQKDKGWSDVKLYVFDVPNAKGNLMQRLAKLKNYLAEHPAPHIVVLEQIPIQSRQQVQDFLNHVIAQKGEGIVVRNPNAPYEHQRSSQILKIKPQQDEECTVTAYYPGKGKYAQWLGAIGCKNQRGTFKIGSGFTDEERKNPPAIGQVITYKYRGLTEKGLPRFATFWRVRSDVVQEKTQTAP